MKKEYNFSELNEFNLLNISREILQLSFGYNFSENFSLDGLRPDLVHINPEDNSVDVLVEIKGTQEITADSAAQINKRLEKYIKTIKPKKVILLCFSNINKTAESILFNSFENLTFRNYEILQLDWIQQKFINNPVLGAKFDFRNDIVSSEDIIDTEKIQNVDSALKMLELQNSGKRFFAAGHHWGNENQIDRFLNEGIWENGHDIKFTNVVKRARIGDVLFLKATVRKGKIGSLRIRAVGVVVKPSETGTLLKVKWQAIPQFDLKGRGGTMGTFNQIHSPNLNNILNDIYRDYPEVLKIIEDLLSQVQKSRNTLNELFNKGNNDSQQFWWLNVPKVFENEFFTNSKEQLYGLESVDKIQLQKFGQIKKGDLCVIYQNNKLNSIALVFENASAEVPNNILLQLDYKFTEKEQIPLEYFRNLEYFRKSKVVAEDNKDSIYPLAEEEYQEVILTTVAKDDYDIIEDEDANLDEPTLNKNSNDKIPFHLDQVVNDDKLGREPVAKAFANLIKNDVFTDKNNDSFMVHLQGEWGSGKSSFLNFIKKHLNSDSEKWIVINYNAWQNQHITPPWWTLIDHIYRQSKHELPWWNISLWAKEKLRRVILYSGWQKGLTFILTIGFATMIFIFGDSILEILKNKSIVTADPKPATELIIEVLANLIITIGSVIGVIYSLSKFISTPFFMTSSLDAVSFMNRAADPMNKIKEHFNDLVSDINKPKKRQLVIFIDDIDRCNKEFIVQLLEGIQTLFKEKRVLYIVAGDKNWITTSFGNTYKEFAVKEITSKKSANNESATDEYASHQLGELFLEKAFQLSFRMPKVEEGVKKEYWNYILGVKESGEEIKAIRSFDDLNKAAQNEIEQAVSKEKDIASTSFLQKLETDYNLSSDAATNYVIEIKNKEKDELRHLLKEFYKDIDSNPRSIIRLANHYTMTRSTIIAERKDISSEKIFRWLVIEDLFPQIKNELKKIETIDGLKAYFNKNIENKRKQGVCLNLLLDEQNISGGALELEEIKNIIGL